MSRLMTRLIKTLMLRWGVVAFVVVMGLLSSATASASDWERLGAAQTPVAQNVETSDQTPYIRTEVRDGYLYLTIERDAPVKVFTILGQLVTSQQLGAGRWRLPLKARGIYILKIGPVTRRVTY